jgi:phosphoribosylformylglycinamidine synthase
VSPVFAGETLLALLARPTVGSKRWVYEQYDQQVGAGTILKPGAADAAVVRLPRTERGVALAVGCNARFCRIDPRLGAMHAVAECYRNISCVGGEPLAITDCLNFASPERPEVMWEFAEAVDGLAEACRALGTPVVSGNVSFYNETEGRGVWPTPEVGMVGLVEQVGRAARMAFRAGARVALVGRLTGELGGSEYAAMRGQVAGPLPRLDLDLEARVSRAVRRMVREGVALSAHDCSEGGLGVALAESCIAGEIGARVRVDGHLFSEEPSRIVVSYTDRARAEAICRDAGAPFVDLGETGGDALAIDGLLSVPVASLARAHAGALSRVTG